MQFAFGQAAALAVADFFGQVIEAAAIFGDQRGVKTFNIDALHRFAICRLASHLAARHYDTAAPDHRWCTVTLHITFGTQHIDLAPALDALLKDLIVQKVAQLLETIDALVILGHAIIIDLRALGAFEFIFVSVEFSARTANGPTSRELFRPATQGVMTLRGCGVLWRFEVFVAKPRTLRPAPMRK